MLKKMLLVAVLAVSEYSFAQSKFSIIPSVGFAWRTAENPTGLSNQEEEYLKGLKSGLNVDLSAYYHLQSNIAFGVKFSNYSASSSGVLSGTDSMGQVISAAVSTDDNITFFGPAFMISNFTEATKHKLFLDLGVGVISYTTKTANIKGTGSNVGVEMNAGYQYALTPKIFLGPKVGLTGGTLTKMKYNGQTVDFGDQKEGLSRVSLSAAATFRF
jgi:hypothetical protein